MTELRVFVPGDPITQGSVVPGVTNAGKLYVRADRRGLRTWRDTVAWRARAAWRLEPLAGAVEVELAFILPRHGSLPKRRLPFASKKGSGDLDKLIRAIFDALTTAGVWRDDAQVVRETSSKRYAKPAERPGAWVTVRPCTDSTLGADPPKRAASAR